jgi:Zn-dependent M28 family amino/carboxypeptidase
MGERFSLSTPDGNSGRPAIEGWISREAAADVLAMAGLDLEVLKARARTRAFEPVALGVTASFTMDQRIRRVVSQNVMARLRGRDRARAGEYVVYTAHWDHFGIGAPGADGDTIYHGASDNASGTATVLEIARAFKALPTAPKRTVVFVAVTAEEQGLLGSEYYGRFPLYPLERTLANINVDGMNMWGKTSDVTVIGLGASDLDDYLAAAAKEQNRTLIPDPESEKGFYYRSDHFNFAKVGVPALYTDDGITFIGKPAGYGQEKRDYYIANDYHKPSDRVKPDWDLAGLAEDGKLLFAVGYRVAMAPTYPAWKPGNEFKAIRDKALSR